MKSNLTDSERKSLSIAAVGASHEISELIRIIERLTGEEIIPADERPKRRFLNEY